MSKTIEQVTRIYQKKSQLEHILLRPDTYVGSVESVSTPMWVLQEDKFVFKTISYVPGLYKIFDELLVNAADNKIRDPTMDCIKVTIDKENNSISVYNNGYGIPIEIHKEEGVYVPELIFGHLLTSSNYDDNEKKVTGGRNGYGAKLCNIFSTEFIIETADSRSGQKFKQVFSANMSKKTKPSITENKKDEDFTKITFKPDLAKFGMSCIDDDLESLLKKRAYDLAGCLKGVHVYLNGTRIKIRDFKQYVDLYISSTQTEGGAVSRPAVIYERINDRWEVAVTSSDGQFQQVSFVNSICTSKGGTHVGHVVDQLVSTLIEAVKKKDKKMAPIKPFQAKNHLWVFVNCLIENPSFDSQTKENMTLRVSAFGSKCDIQEDYHKKVLKSGIVENILNSAKLKSEQALKKSDGHKSSRISGITKLDDANNAGTRNGSKCTLILTEGDSAKALAVSGLSVVGRDNFGVFPLRGKLLNVREASHSQIMGNAEINAIKQIMGLQHGKVYQNTDSLRYGHLMIMTDQDHDGSHIKGLIINFLDHFWPSLLKVPDFLLEFITPIVKATKGKDRNKQEISFFTLPEYENWKKENDDGRGWHIKYYKGLGTSTRDDAKKYFSNMNQHRKAFSACENEDRSLVDMAFNKKKADDRKEWLRQFKPGTFMDHSANKIKLSDFINKELILFSMADNARSIPSVVDGLKPGQRKILFACFKRKLKTEIKVAQLSGYVAEHSAYHHGEQSLCSTIVGLAQNFAGSNNLNYLEPLGQFGTRLQGGKDAASARYIFTSLTPLTRSLFNGDDDALLAYLNDDGQSIEPEWYIPILPTVLVNGSEGIGTGWSSFIPNYNPKEICSNLIQMINGEEPEPMHPWYRGFKGEITPAGSEKYKVSGILEKLDSNTIEITELPIRSWTQNYKEFLEEALQGTEKVPAWIRDYKEYHTDASVHFVVTLSDEQMKKAEEEGLEKRFKISTTISTSNMVCFDKEGRIKKYDTVDTILRDFYDLRLTFYQKRKEYLLDQLTNEWTRFDNKVRFVTEIISGKLVIQNRKKADLMAELQKREYARMVTKDGKVVEEEGEEEETSSTGYDYLLSMPLWNLTWEKVQQLTNERDQKAQQVKDLTQQTPKMLWKTDLEVFLVQWENFLTEMENADDYSGTRVKRPGSSKTKTKKKSYDDDDTEMSSDDYDAKPKKAVIKKVIEPKPKVESKPKVEPKPKLESKPKTAPKSTKAKVQTTLDSYRTTATILSSSRETTPEVQPLKATKKPLAKPSRGASPDLDFDSLEAKLAKKATALSKKPVEEKKVPKKRAASKQKLPNDDVEDFVIEAAPKAPPKSVAVKKKRTVVDSDESDDDIVVVPVPTPAPRAARAPKKPAAYIVDSSESGSENEESFKGSEDESEDYESE